MNIHEIERIISEHTGRTVTFGPLTIVDGIPRKGVLVDGIPLDFKWVPEESGSFHEFHSDEDMADALINSIVQAIKDTEVVPWEEARERLMKLD